LGELKGVAEIALARERLDRIGATPTYSPLAWGRTMIGCRRRRIFVT
jgi:hypothetical protein